MDLHECLSKLAVEKTGTLDWAGLFSFYDKNRDNLLDKNELKGMVSEAGQTFVAVTDAEIAFIFNVLSFFSRYLKKSLFLDWVQDLRGRKKKDLIYYSQYLDL